MDPDETEWKAFLKHPYTTLRSLGFPPSIQEMTVENANFLLAQITLAAINTGGDLPGTARSLREMTRERRPKRPTHKETPAM
jgi:hypothetical protein